MTTTRAPFIIAPSEGLNVRYPRGYPATTGPLGKAWAEIWNALEDAPDHLDGRALADKVAPKYGLVPATLVAVLSRAAHVGLLEKEARNVSSGERGMRKRTHYRIKA